MEHARTFTAALKLLAEVTGPTGGTYRPLVIDVEDDVVRCRNCTYLWVREPDGDAA